MSSEKDEIGEFLNSGQIVMAEIQYPSTNIPIYQEEDHGGDVLEYAEPWGGPQNAPYKDLSKPNALEQDEPITYQGERPNTFGDGVAEEYRPVPVTNIGDGFAITPDPTQGDGAPTSSDFVFVKPRGEGPSPHDLNVETIVHTEPYDYQGDAEDQSFYDRSYVYASVGEKEMKISKEMVRRVASKAAQRKESQDFNPYRIHVAFMDDLYSFERVSADKLIHKSSKELWTITTAEDGSTFIEKQFDGSKPVKA